MIQGQINLHTHPGMKINEISRLEEVNTIVEIGTWNGAGSTACVIAGIKNKPNAKFYSLECDEQQYNLATSIVDKAENVHLLLGKIVEDTELDIENLSAAEVGWLAGDREALSKVPNVLEQLPETIDFLILDGGEFSTKAEFEKLKDRSKYIFLDDTAIRKNKANRANLLADNNFTTIEDKLTDRNGWGLYKRT
jgi:hypothetical protein